MTEQISSDFGLECIKERYVTYQKPPQLQRSRQKKTTGRKINEKEKEENPFPSSSFWVRNNDFLALISPFRCLWRAFRLQRQSFGSLVVVVGYAVVHGKTMIDSPVSAVFFSIRRSITKVDFEKEQKNENAGMKPIRRRYSGPQTPSCNCRRR